MKESQFHEWLRGLLSPEKGVQIGFGDDAAVLGSGDSRVAAAADMVVEGIHFDPATALPAQIGAKAVNRSLSDFAAMGLEPRWVLVAAALPPGIPEASLKEMVLAMKEAAARFGAVLVGGDTARSAATGSAGRGPARSVEPEQPAYGVAEEAHQR